MSCYDGLKKIDPIFSVILTHRTETKKKNELYVFFGDRKMSAAVKRLFKNAKLSAADKSSLKADYPLEADKWIQYNKNSKVHLVRDVIRPDETLYHVRRKIFRYISQPGKNIYYPETNQMIWVRTGKENGKKYRIVGYIYDTLDYTPAPYVKTPKPNALLVDEHGIISTEYDVINQNRFVMRDLFDLSKSENLFLYMYPFTSELNYLTKQKIKIDESLINGYIKLYWPDVKPDLKTKDLKILYSKTSEELEREKYVHRLAQCTDIKKSPLEQCHLMSFKVIVNDQSNEKYIDLLKVFNFMKARVSQEMPVVIYQDQEWTSPNIVVASRAIEERWVTQERLLDWTLDMTELRRTGNMKYKNYSERVVVRLHDYTNIDDAGRREEKYIVLVIRDTGMLEIFINYTEKIKGSLSRVSDAMKKVTDLIESLNKIDYRLNSQVDKNKKIEPPVIKYRSDKFEISDNTQLQTSNWFSFYKIKKKLEQKDFNKLVQLFYPYVSETPITNPDFLMMKYKRISNYKSMDEIFENISEWKEDDRSDVWITKKIRLEYGRTEKQALDILYEWKKAYRVRTDEGYVAKQSGNTLKFNLNKNKVTMGGVNDIQVLLDIFHFLTVFLDIYENLDTHLKDRKFKAVWKDPKKYVVEEEEYEEIILDETDLDLDVDINFNMNDLEIENALLDLSNIEDVEVNREIVMGEEEIVMTDENIEMLPHLKYKGDVEERYELQCADEDLVHDTCQDLCNDNNYFLRRLQRREPSLFNYPTSSSFPKSYARVCQSGYQPVILSYNPDERKDLDRSSYTYSMKYGSDADHQFWYICPQVWCPTHEKSYPISQIKDKEKRLTARVNNKCFVGKCPEGNHQVFWREKKYIYPGFKKDEKTPDGKCIPCCFKKDSRNKPVYKICLGEEVEDVGEKDRSYLIDYRESRRLLYNRYGLLPEYVVKLFQCQCPPGPMQKGMSCYLAKGIKESPRRISFLGAIGDLISKDKEDTLTAEQIMKQLEQKLTPKLFRSLANGVLEVIFDNPDDEDLTAYDNFKKFLRTKSENISQKYLWDLVTRPGVLTEDGFNLVILTRDTMLCPVGEYVDQFYDLTRPWAFIFDHRGFYQPIYHVKNVDGKFIQRCWFNPNEDAEVKRIYDILQENCVQRSLTMTSVLRENEKEYGIKYDYDVKKDATLVETLDELEKLGEKGYQIKEQVMDKYNHVAAIVLENGLYLPVRPSGLIIRYPTTDKFKLLSYTDTLAKLRHLCKKTNLNVAPRYKMLNPEGAGVNAILTEAERVVPVKPTKSVPNDSLKTSNWSFYPEADTDIEEGIYFDDDRKLMVARYTYEEESYQRIRLEISKYLQSHPKTVEKILDIVTNKELSVPERRRNIKDVLNLLFRELVTTSGKTVNLGNYVLPNQRSACSKHKKGCKDPHCVKKGDKCLVYIHPKNLITGKDNLLTYKSRLADELVRNQKMRDDILYDSIRYVVDRKLIDAPRGATVIYGDTILRDISRLYKKRGDVYISPYEPFDRKNPSDLTLLYGEENLFLHVENLSQYWMEILCSEFVVHTNSCEEQSLFCALADALNYMAEKAQVEVEQRAKKYTEKKLREILSHAIKELGIRFVRNLALALNIPLPPELEKSSSPNEIVLYLYNRVKGKNFREFKSLQEYILSEEYPSDFIDAYILSENMKVNLCILEKYIKERDMTFVDNGSDFYVLLYVEQVKKRLVFALIKRDNRAVFELEHLTTHFRNKLAGVDNKDEKEDEEKMISHIEMVVEKVDK